MQIGALSTHTPPAAPGWPFTYTFQTEHPLTHQATPPAPASARNPHTALAGGRMGPRRPHRPGEKPAVSTELGESQCPVSDGMSEAEAANI